MKRHLRTNFMTFQTPIYFPKHIVNIRGIVKTSQKPTLSLVDPTNKVLVVLGKNSQIILLCFWGRTYYCVYSCLKAKYHWNCDGLIWWWCECALMRVLAGSITPPCIIHQPSYQRSNHLKYYETICSVRCDYKSKDISNINQQHTWSFSPVPQAQKNCGKIWAKNLENY